MLDKKYLLAISRTLTVHAIRVATRHVRIMKVLNRVIEIAFD
jgi:hypothetical protein